MSNYTKTTDFAAKDSLPSGDSGKIIRGSDFETEFDAIATAITSKAESASPTFTGTATIPTAAVTTLSLGGVSVTSTAAELNILDGVTATTAELNYVDGVTSAIQTQLDAKAPTASPTFTGTVTIPTADINGGNIDGTTIGGTTTAAGSFTTITGSGDMAIDTDTLFVDVSADKVGIGTSSPATPLHASDSGNELARLQSTGTTGSYLTFLDADTTSGQKAYIGADGDLFKFWSNNSTLNMTMTTDGRVGIGTSSPAVTADIHKNDGIGRQNVLRVLAGGNANNNGATLTLGSTQTQAGYVSGLQTATNEGALTFGVQSSGAYSESMRIDSSGNVGIGTSSPDTLLNLESAAPTTRLAPTTQNNASSLELGVLNSGTTAYAKIDAVNLSTYDTNLRFYTNTSSSTTQVERMRIDSNGVVIFKNGTVQESTTITSSSNAATLNLRDGDNFVHDLTENVTYTFSNPGSSGTVSAFSLKVIQGATARTITWPSSVDWAGGTAPTLSTANDAVDVFVFFTHDGGTTYYGFTAGQAMA